METRDVLIAKMSHANMLININLAMLLKAEQRHKNTKDQLFFDKDEILQLIDKRKAVDLRLKKYMSNKIIKLTTLICMY